MIKGGKGGANTLTGLSFEKRIDLQKAFSEIPGYAVKNNELFFKRKVVARFYKKNSLYKFLDECNADWRNKVSKKLLPDEAIFVINKNTLFIIEMKFQHVSGSVDEKLQTCDFKKKQYEKLVGDAGIKVEYCYVLSKWFQKKEYKDVLEYINSVKCLYFFEKLPFSFLGLPGSKDS